MVIRPSLLFIAAVSAGALLLAVLFSHARTREKADLPALHALARLAGELSLTDLALFTEARYTRHPSQADLHTAFQEHPAALDHFPSGSFLSPPKGRR